MERNKIMFATLNRDADSDTYRFENPEELEAARRYNGNVSDFIRDYIICASLVRCDGIHEVKGVNVNGAPEGAVFLAYTGEEPSIIVWAE